MTHFDQARINMVDGQIHPSGVVDPKILEAFSTVPREKFVPERLRSIAYTDEDIDIGQGRYLLAPITYSRMLQEVGVCESDVVLDVASGSGYSSAILSSLTSTVIALEKNVRHMDKAKKLWQSQDMCNVVLVEQDDITAGAQKHAPYSLIIINGGVRDVPDNIFDQLDYGGRLVTVVHDKKCSMGTVTLFVKSQNGNVSSRPLFESGTPLLKEFDKVPAFVF